ncbi:HNH endonuclease signature motif containing protein [Pukyongiella litopenaei]|uniref:HNH endonuclease n=1 Tax=Pukyongiella litopenaei TaxID=2605946 RepID=A0A2S0MQ10_9RHOB|nr:HNH endonuclease signature motif containing protein [Pukyongiella litopenaei]AVO37926.1 HNH endonuclease [Pukyongiella litopenaei]
MSDLQTCLFPELPLPDAVELHRRRNARAQQTYRDNPASAPKIAARLQVAQAIQRGELERADLCGDCGMRRRTEGHHVNYARPLDVIWLCRTCHMARHRNSRSLAGQLALPLEEALSMRSDDDQGPRAWERLTMTGELLALCERAGWNMAATLEAAGANDCALPGAPHDLVRTAILEALGARLGNIGHHHIRPGAFLSPNELSGALGVSEAIADALVLALLDLGVLEFGPPQRIAPWIWWRAVAAMRGELERC